MHVGSPRAFPAFDAELAGERVELLAGRALHWPRASTIYVADVHLGKAAAFRASGVPLPGGSTAADLSRLADLVASTRAERVVILGDLIHAAAGRTQALDRAVERWRASCAALDVTLVRGNHDRRSGDPPASWRVNVVAEPYAEPPFLLRHHPVDDDACGDLFGYALCGHVHPGVRLHGPGLQSERLPCFVLGTARAVLPAFGGFTGLADVVPGPSDTIVVIAGERLFRVPSFRFRGP